MLKEFVWKTFENTGGIEFYMFYREIEEKSIGLCEGSLAVDEAAMAELLAGAVLPV